MKILSCGAGMQSSALHLMSCENALAKKRGEPPVWPQVPIYDISIFCNLGLEPPWVKKQVEFLANAGHSCGVPLVILDSPLYTDFMENFGEQSASRGGRSGMTATKAKCLATAPSTTR